MYKVKDIAKKIEELAPLSLAEPWDNVGLMVGDMNADISRVFVCLDVTSENAAAAIDCGANLIVSHHPLLFSPLKRISENDVIGSTVMSLIRNDISVYSAHTNFDNAIGGMNDILAEKLELIDIRVYTDEECRDALGNPTCKIGRVGRLESSAVAQSDMSATRPKQYPMLLFAAVRAATEFIPRITPVRMSMLPPI
ncbi:MAG: Nif3-like dinuclear metal center hexameric protein [Clostridiales bacterium]|nr:Nif3-like dinuclear metal center hexameric protein [Clostridiales bacterium]